MSFGNGAGGLLVAGWVLDGGFPGIRIRLHGARALAEVRVDHRLPGGQSYVVTEPVGAGPMEQPLEPMRGVEIDAPRRHLAAFVASLRGEVVSDGTLPTLREGAQVQAVLEAALNATAAWQSVPPDAAPAGAAA